MRDKILILCCREFQASIERSTYAELRAFIYEYNLEVFFTVKHDKIVGKNGSEFIFLGLARDPYGLKGIPNIGICYIDEAETISNFSWEILIPTVEKNDNSELILSFNPRDSQSATYLRFITNAHELSGKNLFIEINYPDNPYLSKKQLATILKLKETNYALYEHIYLGKVLDMSEDVIFKGRFKIDEIKMEYSSRKIWSYKGKILAPLYGMDFGFSTDPLAIIEIFMLDEDTLYITREIYETGLLITKVPQRIKEVMPEALNDVFYGDNASPDKIAQLNHEGIKCIGATKGKGSVEAGVDWLLSKNIIIHPDCKNTIYEFYNYKYKVDKNSGKITREIIDANNHACLTGDTLVDTEFGKVRIDELINKEGNVWSFNQKTNQAELNYFYNVMLTNHNAEIYQIELEDGRIIKGTPDHPCLTQRGWVEIQHLLESDIIIDVSDSVNV